MSAERPQSRPKPAAQSGAERRRHPRARIEGIVTLALKSGVHNAKLRDISRSGVSFYLDRKVPLMTLLELKLDLPGRGNAQIAARGAVVRCEPISTGVDHYEIAVFLHETGEQERAAIDAFVAARASAKTSHSASSVGE